MGWLLVMLPELKLPFFDAASSATKEDRTEVSICAEEVEAASLAAIAAAAAFLCCSSVLVKEDVKEVMSCGGCTWRPFNIWKARLASGIDDVSTDVVVGLGGLWQMIGLGLGMMVAPADPIFCLKLFARSVSR